MCGNSDAGNRFHTNLSRERQSIKPRRGPTREDDDDEPNKCPAVAASCGDDEPNKRRAVPASCAAISVAHVDVRQSIKPRQGPTREDDNDEPNKRRAVAASCTAISVAHPPLQHTMRRYWRMTPDPVALMDSGHVHWAPPAIPTIAMFISIHVVPKWVSKLPAAAAMNDRMWEPPLQPWMTGSSGFSSSPGKRWFSSSK
jgi:hypothetical protein